MTDTYDYVRIFPWAMEFKGGAGSTPGREIGPAFLVSVLLEELSEFRVGGFFSTIPRSASIDRIRMGVRMHNVLVREGMDTFDSIASRTLEELLALRGAGVGSVRTLLLGLIEHAVQLDIEPEVSVDDEVAELDPAWRSEMIADIETLARWHRLLGEEETSVFVAPEGISEPREVAAARARLAVLSAAAILPPLEGEGAAAAAVDRALDALDERQLEVVTARVFADQPATLDALGDRFGVTRERIRQVETKALNLLRTRMGDGDLHVLASVVRDAIGRLITLRVLEQRYPTVGDRVPRVGQPVWRVLDRLDDAYEIKDGWCASGTLGDAIARTKALLAESAAGRDFVELGSIEGDETELSAEWLEHCGIALLDGCAFIGRPSIQDRAEVVLFTRQEPMTSERILASLGVQRALSALKNQLSDDERFTRVDRDMWALSSWGMTGYLGIRAMIGRALDAAGGELALDELVADLTSRYDVSARSVVSYASTYPYITERSRVRRRGRRDMRRIRRKGLAQTRALYRHDASVKLRFTVNSEHLRGSGSPLPNAIGEEIDLSRAEARHLPLVAGGTIQVSWRGPQITLGSVRSEVDRLGLTPGDTAFFVFHSDGSFEVEPTESAADAAGRAAALTGGSAASSEDVFAVIADRIDAGDPSREGVIAALAARGDAVVVDAING